MVEIVKLELTSDNGIYLNCKVPNVSYLENVYIKKVTIETQDTYKDGAYSGVDIYHTQQESLRTKNLELLIPSNELLIDNSAVRNTLYLVHIETEGEPGASTPCGVDSNPTISILFNKVLFIEKLLSLQSRTNKCDTNKDLIDYALLFKAFLLSIELKDYNRTIEYWKLLTNNNQNSSTNGCQCSKL